MDNKQYKLQSIRILGAYGTKSKGHGTSSFLLNQNNVIDAGNLLDSLDSQTVQLKNVWITHSHLDHIVDIAHILDNYYSLRNKPLNIIGLPQTLKAIQENFLNDTIWPDFSKIKLLNSDNMAVTYMELEKNKKYEIGQGEYIEAFETDHTVVSCGYIYTKNNASVMITADTYSLDNVIKILHNNKNITSLVVECSFPNAMKELAIQSKHLTPELLFNQLKVLKCNDLMLYINHIKPAYLKNITDEIEENRGKWEPIILKDGDCINF